MKDSLLLEIHSHTREYSECSHIPALTLAQEVRDKGLRDWLRHKFTALAGTDTHGEGYAGTYPTQFDHWVDTLQDLVTEIRSGRCRPFFKEIPRTGANLQVTEIVVGTKGRKETRERWIIKRLHGRSKWEKAPHAYRVMEEVFQKGFDRGR